MSRAALALLLLGALPLHADTSRRHSPFDPRNAAVVRSIDAHRGAVRAIAFAADQRTFATIGGERALKVWRAGVREPRVVPGTYQVENVWLSRDARIVVALSGTSVVGYDLDTGKTIGSIDNIAWRRFAVSPDGARVIATTAEMQSAVFDLARGTKLFTAEGEGALAYAWSPDGKRIVMAGQDGSVRVCSASDGKQIFLLENAGALLTGDVKFSPDGKLILVTTNDGATRVFNGENGDQVLTAERTSGAHRCAAVSKDGKTLATGHQDGAIRLWDLKTGKEIRRLDGHASGVRALGFSPDGRTLVSGGNDGAVRIWARGFAPPPKPGPERSGKPGFLGMTGADGAGDRGVVVDSVIAGTAAEKGGLKVGDLILGVGGNDVNTFEELRSVVTGLQEGDELEVRIERDGKEQKLKVKLGARP